MTTKNLTLGTAKITEANGTLTVEFMRTTNFSVGTQTFGNSSKGWNAALCFIREAGLRVI